MVDAGREIDVHHGAVEVFAYQEALMIMAVFGIAILAMAWAGFRRWLQHKENMGRLIAEQAAERSGHHGAQMERIESRLKAVEQIVTNGGVQAPAQIETSTSPAADQVSKSGQLGANP